MFRKAREYTYVVMFHRKEKEILPVEDGQKVKIKGGPAEG